MAHRKGKHKSEWLFNNYNDYLYYRVYIDKPIYIYKQNWKPHKQGCHTKQSYKILNHI